MVSQQTPPSAETDAVTQEQQQLDQQQGATALTPQFVTYEQLQSLLGQQAQRYERQISGLQGKIDTGLNAIRRDTQQVVQGQKRIQREQVLSSLDEETRQRIAPLFQETESAEQAAGSAQANDVPTPQPNNMDSQVQAQWQQVHQMVRNMGVDPGARGIDYAALTVSGLDDNARQQRFFTSVWAVKAQSQNVQRPANAPAVSQRAAAPQTANPPVEQQAAVGGGFRSFDDVRDAYISDRISSEQYREQARKFGVSV